MVVANPLKIQHKILFAASLYKCLLAMVVANPQKFSIKFSLHLAFTTCLRKSGPWQIMCPPINSVLKIVASNN